MEIGSTAKGQAWQLFVIMDGDRPVMVVAKNPHKPQVVDVSEELRALLFPTPQPSR